MIEFTATVWPNLLPGPRADRFWWRRADPSGAVAAVHQTTGAMAGLCGGRRIEWTVAGRTHPALAITDWYVDPAHAGHGIGKRLIQGFEAPGRFVYAISLSDAAIVNFKKLGWRGPHRSSLMLLPVPRLARLLAALRRHPGDIDLQDHVASGGELPAALAAALDRIDGRVTLGGLAHMRRGAAEWRDRLPVRAERTYRFCIAHLAGEPAGYVVVRRATPGRIRAFGKMEAALVVDLIADDPRVVRVLAARAVAIAGELNAAIAMAITTIPAHERVLRRLGFVSPAWPLIGKLIGRRAPQFMWVPKGPAAGFTGAEMALTLADGPIDFDL